MEEKKAVPEIKEEEPRGLERMPHEWLVERREFYYRDLASAYDEVHLIDYINILLKRRWLIIWGVFLTVLFTGIFSLRTPPTFTATTKFFPSKSPDMISRMGTLVGAGGKIETYEDNVTSEYFVELLKSSSFQERIAQKKFYSKLFGQEVDLITYYKINEPNENLRLIKAVKAISSNLKVSIDRTTKVISLSYSSREPELSAAVANAFVEELIVFNQDIRDTKAKLNRIFIEKQLEENQALLKKAEAELADFIARNKKIATPDLEMELDRLKRNVKVQEEVYITLKRQLELAKIEEQERKPTIEIIEKAKIPIAKSKPRTKMNVILAFFIGSFIFIGLAFVLEWLKKLNADEEKSREFAQYINDIKNDFRRLLRPCLKK
jgi:uncharacterized protein involved in exopolysaccharide biosynthesis